MERRHPRMRLRQGGERVGGCALRRWVGQWGGAVGPTRGQGGGKEGWKARACLTFGGKGEGAELGAAPWVGCC